MDRDPIQSSTLHVVPDAIDGDDSAHDAADQITEAFRAGWLAGGLQDRLAA
jgi:hypothetical protein